MTSHELARELLEQEDLTISYRSGKAEGDFVSGFIVTTIIDPYNIYKQEKTILLNGTKS